MPATVEMPVQRSALRISASAMVVWLCWLGMVACAAIFISRHEVQVPRHDEWESFARLIGEKPVTLSWLWAFQNEHRIPLQRVLYIASIRAVGLRFSGGMYLNLAMLATAAALFMVAARRLRGHWSWVDLAFPALFLHLGQYENYLNSFQIQFVAGTLLTAGLTVQFLLLNALPDWRRMAGIGAILLLLPLDGGSTLVFVPPVALWMLVTLILAWHSKSVGRFKTIAVGLVCLGLCTAICYAYFQNFARSTQPVFSFRDLVRGACEFACTAWGAGCIPVAWVFGGLAGLMLGGAAMLTLCIISGVSLLRALGHDRANRARTLGLLAMLVGSGLLIGSIAYGRGMVAELWGTSPRYAGLLAPALALCVLLLNIQQARLLRRLGAAAAAIVLLALVPNSREGLMAAHRQDADYAALERDVAARLPIDALVIRHAHFLYASNPLLTERWVLEMQEHRIGPFAQLAAPLRRTSVGQIRMPLAITPTPNNMRYDAASETWESTGPDPHLLYELPEMPQIAGIRMSTMVSRPEGAGRLEPYADTEYFWAQQPSERFTPLERHLRVRNAIGSVVDQRVWIYGKANRLRIDPDSWPCRFAVKNMEMLAIPADAQANPLYQLAQETASTSGDGPYLVSAEPGQQQLVFFLPTIFHLNVAGKQSLRVDVGPWREETFRRVYLRISGSGIEAEYVFIPDKGEHPLQVQLPQGASDIDLEFTSQQPSGQVKAALSLFELR